MNKNVIRQILYLARWMALGLSLAASLALVLSGCAPLPPPPAVEGRTPATRTHDEVRSDGALQPSTGAILAWTHALGGEINWAPQLLVPETGPSLVIVSSEAGSVVALTEESGQEMWRFTPETRLWTDSVTVLNDAVFAASAEGNMALLDGNTGAVLWRASVQPAGQPPLLGLEARSKPTVADNVIYVPTSGIGSYATITNPQLHVPLIALDYATGNELWRTQTDNFILRAPFVDPQTDMLYVGGNYLSDREIDEGGPFRLYALNRRNGALQWLYESDDGLVKSLWANQDVVVFVGYRDFLVGVEASSGEELWRQTTGNWVQSFAVLDLPQDNKGAVVVYGSANAFLNVVDPQTGRMLWRYNIEGTFNYVIGNAVLQDDSVYFISQRGDLHALDARSGALRWKQATGLETRDGIAVSANYIFVGSVAGTVYAFQIVR